MKGLPAQDAAASWCRLLEWDVWAGSFSMVGAPGHHRVLSSFPGFYPLDTAPPTKNVLSHVPWGANHP